MSVDELKARREELAEEADVWRERAPELRERVEALEGRHGEVALDGDDEELATLEGELEDARRELERGEAAQRAREDRLERLDEEMAAAEAQRARDRYNGLRSAQSKTARKAQEKAEELATVLDELVERQVKISNTARKVPDVSRRRLGLAARALVHWVADTLRPSAHGHLFSDLGDVRRAWRGQSLPQLLGFEDDSDDDARSAA